MRIGKARVYGRVGSYARRLYWAAVLKAVATLVFGVGGAAAIWKMGGHPVAVVILGGGALTGFQKFRGDAAKASAGVRSERRALAELRKHAAAVVCGVKPLYGGDLDLVGVGPWFGVVEVKTGRGPVVVLKGGALRTGRRVLPGHPVTQAAKAGREAAKIAGRPAESVVCVVDMEGPPLRVERNGGTTWVCSLRDLGRVVGSFPAMVREGEVEGVVSALLSADTSKNSGAKTAA